MAQKSNRYQKITPGFNAEVFVGRALAYTTDADLDTFRLNAPDGELGIYKEVPDDDPQLLTNAAATPTDASLIIALKRGNFVHTSTTFKLAELAVTKIPYAAPVKNRWSLVTSGSVAAGDVLSLLITDITVAGQLEKYRYNYTVASGDTLTTAITKLVNIINDQTTIDNEAHDKIFTASVVNTDDIQIDADSVGTMLRIGTSGKLTSLVTITQSQKPFFGNNTPTQVLEFEKAGDIFRGVTTNYPEGGTVPAEWGAPPSEVNASGQYVCYKLEGYVYEVSHGPIDRHTHKKTILLFVEDGAADPIAVLDVVFNLVAPA